MTTDHDAELEAAGLITIETDAEGRTVYTLTREGAAVGRELAMTAGEDERLSNITEPMEPDANRDES